MDDVKDASLLHPEEPFLFDMALGRAPDAIRLHAGDCGPCGRRVLKYRLFIADIRMEHAFHQQVEAEKATRRDPEMTDSPAYRNVQNLLRLARLGDADAEELVRAAELGEEELVATLTELSPQPQFPFALLYSCQGGARLAAHVPNRALALAKGVEPWADRLPDAAPGRPVSRPMVLAEAALLTSQAELRLLRAEEAEAQARRARSLFAESNSDPVFDAGRCDYFEASAVAYLGRHDDAMALLTSSALAFAEASQDHWIGRAEGTIALVKIHMGNDPDALEHFETAAALLDPALDATAWSANQLNRGTLLSRLGNNEEARQAFRLALSCALRNGVNSVARDARFNLAELQLQAGEYGTALEHFRVLGQLAHEDRNQARHLYCQLFVAECLGGLGRTREMAVVVGSLREARDGLRDADPALEDLFTSLDRGQLDIEIVAHVCRYLRDREKGNDRTYQGFRVA